MSVYIDSSLDPNRKTLCMIKVMTDNGWIYPIVAMSKHQLATYRYPDGEYNKELAYILRMQRQCCR